MNLYIICGLLLTLILISVWLIYEYVNAPTIEDDFYIVSLKNRRKKSKNNKTRKSRKTKIKNS